MSILKCQEEENIIFNCACTRKGVNKEIYTNIYIYFFWINSLKSCSDNRMHLMMLCEMIKYNMLLWISFRCDWLKNSSKWHFFFLFLVRLSLSTFLYLSLSFFRFDFCVVFCPPTSQNIECHYLYAINKLIPFNGKGRVRESGKK